MSNVFTFFEDFIIFYYTGAESEILKRGGALCRPAWLAGEKKI